MNHMCPKLCKIFLVSSDGVIYHSLKYGIKSLYKRESPIIYGSSEAEVYKKKEKKVNNY